MADAAQNAHAAQYSPPPVPPARAAWYVRTWRVLKQTFVECMTDDIFQMAASVAFYSVLAFAPLVIIALSFASTFWGAQAAREQISGELSAIVGEKIATGLQSVLHHADRPDLRHPATVLGLSMLLVSATAVFVQLQTSMNIIWNVRPLKNSLWFFVRKRLMSLLMLAVVALLFLLSMIASAVLGLMSSWLGPDVAGTKLLLDLSNAAVGVAVFAVLFAAIFKIMPDADVSWRSALVGAGLTSILFGIGKHAIGIYLRYATFASPYGATGSLVLLLMWVYYSTAIFLIGAEFTHVLASERGEERIEEHAVREGPKQPRHSGSLPSSA
jgi:membrane protein